MVDFVTGLRCRECARTFPAEALHVCDYCFGPLEVAYDYERIAGAVTRARIESGPRSIWRYRDLLPVDDEKPVDLGAGFTPLVRADRLAAELGLGELWIKDDTANPTGSFKDRVVSVALTKARQLGFKVAACASTGNLANSVAAHAARAGLYACPGDRAGDPLVVVGDLQRPEAVVADVQRLGGIRALTLTTTQPSDEIDHRSSSSIGHWHQVRCTGCRDVSGPVPQSLWMMSAMVAPRARSPQHNPTG